jgi:hypothetical protein
MTDIQTDDRQSKRNSKGQGARGASERERETKGGSERGRRDIARREGGREEGAEGGRDIGKETGKTSQEETFLDRYLRETQLQSLLLLCIIAAG